MQGKMQERLGNLPPPLVLVRGKELIPLSHKSSDPRMKRDKKKSSSLAKETTEEGSGFATMAVLRKV